MKPNDKKITTAWCMYDWANSAFATTIMAAILPVYFRNVSTSTLLDTQLNSATVLWGYTASIAMFCVAVLSLILGPVSDFASSRKKFLFLFTGIGVLSTSLLAATGIGEWKWVAIFFILGNIGYAGGEVFYDSMLPHIVKPGTIDRVSTRGYAFGYIGGAILLAINIFMIWYLPKTIVSQTIGEVPILGMQLSFLSVGVWWGFFSLPIFKNVPEPAGIQNGPGRKNLLKIAVTRLVVTLKNTRQHKQLFLFIIAFWFYNDGIGTIIKMATVYGNEIGIGILDLIGALLATQIVGIPFSLIFGKLSGKIGAKQSILCGLGIYIFITIGAFFMTQTIHFWILALMVGLVQGGTQALSRSLFGSMVPKNKSAEFFSFYNISGKFAGIFGPAIFALVSRIAGTGRLGILSLLFFFITGGILLLKVDVEKGKKSATQYNKIQVLSR